MKVKIRDATPHDLSSICWIEKRSYPPELQAPRRILEDRLQALASG